MRTHLDLFSGIGGFALAANWAEFTTVGFCEIDGFCQRVLRKHWPDIPIHDDARTLTGTIVRDWLGGTGLSAEVGSMVNANTGHHQGTGEPLRTGRSGVADTGSSLDLITAGYPCQPFSHAGKRLGQADDRHLWPEVARLVAELRPTWFLGENVAGHISMGLNDVLSDLEALGYACWPVVIPACAVNAPHRRDRVWIVAHAGCTERRPWNPEGCGEEGQEHLHGGWTEGSRGLGQCGEDVADTNTERLPLTQPQSAEPRSAGRAGIGPCSTRESWWEVEPPVGRVVDGLPVGLDILGGLDVDESDGSQADAAASTALWNYLREVWELREPTASPHPLRSNGVPDSLSILPRGSSQGGRVLGSWIEKDQELRRLWADFYSKPQQEAQDMQRELLERIRQKERAQKMETRQRVNRLRGLGNAIVPQVAYQILLAMGDTGPWYNEDNEITRPGDVVSINRASDGHLEQARSR